MFESREKSFAERAAAQIAGTSVEAFARAQKFSARYSLFVNAMRFILPAIALSLIGLIIAWPHVQNTGKARFKLNFANIAPSTASSLTMVKPRFTGVDDSQRPYTVTADNATQVASGSPLIDLEQPVADMTMKDGSWIVLRSAEGTYNQTSHDLDLRGSVDLFHDAGYEFETSRAFMNLQAGIAHGEEPVEGQGPFGHIRSRGFKVTEHGRYVVFTGPAKLILYPKAHKGSNANKGAS